MRSALSYTPRPGPLRDAGAGAAILYFGSFAVVAFSYTNPLVLAGVTAGVVVAGLAAGAGRALAVSARYGIALGALFIAINALTAQRGDTILVRGWDLPVTGRIDVTAEALLEGAVLGWRVVVVMLAFAVLSASVDPDRLLRMMRPVAGRSALTATLITRMAPLAARDQARLREAAELRGPAAAPVGKPVLLRRLVAGALDRAVDVAATLELRGYAQGPPRALSRRPAGRGSRRFAVAGLAILALAVAGRLAGLGAMRSYPVADIAVDPATVLMALAIPLLAALPFARPGRVRSPRPEPAHA
jgi:energy-coupling factor transport system permease protein